MIGNNFKNLRFKIGLTQEDVADKLDIKRATYANYENGITEPPVDVLMKIADFFSVSIDYLLGREFNNGLSNQDKELLDVYEQLASNDKEKILDYCKFILKNSKDQKEKELRDKLKNKK